VVKQVSSEPGRRPLPTQVRIPGTNVVLHLK
jgi:hypothetical protein